MKLLPKTILITLSASALMLAVFYAAFSYFLLDNYRQLEGESLYRDLRRAGDTLNYELARVNEMARDWSAWDDVYEFLQGNGPEFINANLSGTALLAINLQAMLLFDTQGRLRAAPAYRAEDGQPSAWNPAELVAYVQSRPELLQHAAAGSERFGLALLRDSLFMLASQPVVHSDYSGPIGGTLVFARQLDPAFMDGLRERLRMDVRLRRFNSLEVPGEQAILAHLLGTALFEAIPLDDGSVRAYSLLRDLRQRPALLVELRDQRQIYRQGLDAVRGLLYSLLLFGLGFLAVVLWLFQSIVLKRVLRLAGEVQQITDSGDTQARVRADSKDELGQLSQEINQMLSALDEKSLALRREKEKTDALLHNMLPSSIVERMKQGEVMIAERFEGVSVMFADIVGFTEMAQRVSPQDLVELLNQVFSAFDHIAATHRLEKIKTIGDAYMVVAGAPETRADHAEAIAQMALELNAAVSRLNRAFGHVLKIRIGISSGEAVAGVIGTRKFSYDIWGDVVNTAARMESHSLENRIHCTETVHQLLQDKFRFEPRGPIEIKGKGRMSTYFLLGRK